MQPQEKKWRKSITQSLSLQSSSSPGSLGNWPTAQSLLKPCVHVPEPTLSLFPTHPSGCSSPEPITGSSFMLDIHPPYISAWTGPSLFTLWLAGGLSHTFSKSKLISLIMTGEWQELCGGNVSLSTRSQTPFVFPDLCAEFLASRPIPLNVPQAPPYFLPPQRQPFLVKLENDTPVCWAVQRSRPLVTLNLYPSYALSFVKYQTAISIAFTS